MMEKNCQPHKLKRTATVLCAVLLSLLPAGYSPLAAQTPQALFQSANQDYQRADYPQAAAKYDSLVRMGYKSPALFNNLGNTYYRLGRIAPSILAYERAVRLAPTDQEIRRNLQLARNLTADNIVPMGESLSERMADSLAQTLPVSVWSILSVVFAWAALILFLLFLHSLRSKTKRRGYYGFLAALLLCIVCYGLRRYSENQLKDNPYSIVIVSNVTAKSEPSASGGEVFSIHEGTKVRVEETLNRWHKIRLADGKIGWIPVEAVEKI